MTPGTHPIAATDSPPDPDQAAERTSSISAGTAYLYVLPCTWEDHLKLGFSRDPLARMSALHHRFFEFFDLDRAFAVRVDSVREARALELRYARALRLHNALAPLSVNESAGGAREWYRGAYAQLDRVASELAAQGFRVIRPLSDWVRERLLASGPLLYALAMGLPTEQRAARGLASRDSVAQRNLGNLLDAYCALGLDLERWLPADLLQWQRSFSGGDG